MSSGFCVTKYTPTPLERTSRTTCSMRSTSAFGASLNSRCASSKKNTSLGFSRSPTSGSCSNSSDSSHSRKVAYSRGEFISLSAARMLITPLPPIGLHEVGDVEHRLAEELVAALLLELQQAALDGADAGGADVAVLGGELARVLADVLQHGAQVLQVEQQQAVVVGDLEDDCSTPACVSFRSSMRPSSSGPMSEIVARTGWPCSPNTSHSVTGQASGLGRVDAALLERGGQLVAELPAWLMPVRSPLTSAMNTGTPMFESFSARSAA